MSGSNPDYVLANACNRHVKLSLADHDELLYSDFIVKFKHDPTVKDDLRDHIRSSLLSNSKILVAGNPAALAQVFTCYRDLENIDEEPNITQKRYQGIYTVKASLLLIRKPTSR